MRILIFILLFSSISSFSNELKWAADAESGAPYVFNDPKLPGKYIGFEVEIIEAVAKKLNLEPKFVQNQWDGLIPGLERNDYAVAINGLEITPDRREVVNFSNPYYITYLQLVVRKDEDNIKSLSDLADKKAGTLKSSLAERYLFDEGTIDVRSYDSEVNSFEDLKNGRLDAVLIDAPVAVYYAGWNPQLRLVGEPIGEALYGIVMSKSNDELLTKVNSAIDKMIQSGELRKILDRWNLWNVKMEELCGDYSESQTSPIMFDQFIRTQLKEDSFSDLINRYISFIPELSSAAWMTLKLTIFSMLIAIILGLIFAIIKVYAPEPFSFLAKIYIEVIRGTPLLIQLFFIFYALPAVGIKFEPFTAALIGLGINYSAYEAENYRAGLFSVPKGQMEAAISLGMTRNQALRHIIVPQAIRLVIPPITNDFISLLKDSSLVSVIALVELTKLYGKLASTYYDYIGTGIIIALIYLLLGLPFVRLSKRAEKFYSLGHNRARYNRNGKK